MGSANNVLRGGQGRTSLPSADLRMTRYLQASRRWSCFSWRWGSACTSVGRLWSANTIRCTGARWRVAPRRSASRSPSHGTGWPGGSPALVVRLVAEPDAAPLEAENILRALLEHDVEFVLIGGLAVQTHGHVRTTNDADLIPAPDPANLGRLADALSSLGARVLNPGHEEDSVDALILPKATIWQFATRDGGIDVMNEVPGGRSYRDLRERALLVRLGDLQVPVVSLDDLIQMKLARGSPLDLADVAALTDPEAEPST